jgi:hypothetical protein
MLFPFSSNRVLSDYLSAEQLMRVCDLIWSTDRRAHRRTTSRVPIAPGAIVYAKADHFIPLFDQLRHRRSRVVLVTAESDMTVDPEIARARPIQVAEWFSANALDESVRPIPLGLANSYCELTPKAPLLAECATPNETRVRWLYVNFRTETNPAVRGPIMEHFHAIRGDDWITLRKGEVGVKQFAREMSSHRFALCPPGNGIDTHRMWEALYSRTIPIVLRNAALRDFEDLPIAFVDDFRQITLDFLESAYRRMVATEWNSEKMFAPWWQKRLIEARTSLVARGDRVSRAAFCRRLLSAGWASVTRRFAASPERGRIAAHPSA